MSHVVRRTIVFILALVAVSAPSALAAPVANADSIGDPAAIVLASEPAFVPNDVGAGSAEISRLVSTLRVAATHGLPLRVALVGSSGDLGSVTQDWGDPFAYARYLGAELAPTYRGPTLVVMPQGYALWVNGTATHAEQRALSGLTPPGGDLVAGALSVVHRLATANGVALPARLPAPAVSPAPGVRHGGSSPVSIIALVVGGLAVLAAWAVSLRTRPLRTRVPA
ncbi:MAG TPA: hypothetical protein VFN48_05105 [Solirubrobacteraceae bacterium]|nr:hypothetical protein [Solirubrobacteraceae bacterium]